jgi:TrmH family RNA methyltransferase
MLSKSTIKYVRSLRQQKYRQKYHKIVVEGVKTIKDILKDQLLNVETIYASSDRLGIPATGSVPKQPHVIAVEEHELAGISSFTSPQHVLAICDIPDHDADPKAALSGLCLFLDGIRDPGNMGTIFRIADWFGIQAIFLAEDCVDPFNPKVIQASMSSLFRVNWSECPLSQILDQPGIQAYASMSDGESIYDHPLSSQGLIILGNESTGIRDITRRKEIHEIAIPATHRLGAESLNVAVSAGIICAEFRRRKPNTKV